MPDQFSSEYISYVLSDEAKTLQEKWEPKIRDVFIIRNGDCAQFLVVDTLAPKHPFKRWLVSYVYLSPHGPDSGEMATWDAKVSDRTVWLPTLWDLLRIIEGAGYWWALGRNFDFAEKEPYWYDASAGRVDMDGYLQDVEDGLLMLAAAKLAVKAMESMR